MLRLVSEHNNSSCCSHQKQIKRKRKTRKAERYNYSQNSEERERELRLGTSELSFGNNDQEDERNNYKTQSKTRRESAALKNSSSIF